MGVFFSCVVIYRLQAAFECERFFFQVVFYFFPSNPVFFLFFLSLSLSLSSSLSRSIFGKCVWISFHTIVGIWRFVVVLFFVLLPSLDYIFSHSASNIFWSIVIVYVKSVGHLCIVIVFVFDRIDIRLFFPYGSFGQYAIFKSDTFRVNSTHLVNIILLLNGMHETNRPNTVATGAKLK